MCGRYTLIRLNDVLEKFPWIERVDPIIAPRYNIAPTQPILAIANDHPTQLDHFAWGLVPSWAKDTSSAARMINARAETLMLKPTFQRAVRRRRCLVLADGFYEWRTEAPASGKKPVKVPVWFRMRDHKPFAFAGLWDHWQGADGSELRTCTIVTTRPNEMVAGVHDRMPAILRPEHCRAWVEPGEQDESEMMAMLGPYPAEAMEATAVSRHVNSARNEGPACVEGMTKETLF